MKIAVGADHGGFDLKNIIRDHLIEKGHEVIDCGTYSKESVDYPDFALCVALTVARQIAEVGIMIDGAGIGSCMVANKVPGIRASVCNDLYTAGNAREHNCANVLTLGSMVVGSGYAKQIVDKWISIPWTTEPRHIRRIDKITNAENSFQSVEGINQLIKTAIQISEDKIKGTDKKIRKSLIGSLEAGNIIKSGIRKFKPEQSQILTPLARDMLKDNGIYIIE